MLTEMLIMMINTFPSCSRMGANDLYFRVFAVSTAPNSSESSAGVLPSGSRVVYK